MCDEQRPRVEDPDNGVYRETVGGPYGFCPFCGGKGIRREQRPGGHDMCANGHTYLSSTALSEPMQTNLLTNGGATVQELTAHVNEVNGIMLHLLDGLVRRYAGLEVEGVEVNQIQGAEGERLPVLVRVRTCFR